MNDWYLDMQSPTDLQPILDKVDEGDLLDFKELNQLFEATEAKLFRLLEDYQGLDALCLLQDSNWHLSRCLQAACLAVARANVSEQDQRRFRELLNCQLTYQHACLQRSLQSLASR